MDVSEGTAMEPKSGSSEMEDQVDQRETRNVQAVRLQLEALRVCRGPRPIRRWWAGCYLAGPSEKMR